MYVIIIETRWCAGYDVQLPCGRLEFDSQQELAGNKMNNKVEKEI